LLFALLIFLGYSDFEFFFKSSSRGVYRLPDRGDLRIRPVGHGQSILLITVDALRPDYLSANGYDRNVSPAMDQLIQRGLYFSHCVTTIPKTTQSLACLHTGCYPYKTQVRTLWDRLSPQAVTIAEILKDAGYQTIAVVSNSMLSPTRGLNRGFDIYDLGLSSRDAIKTTMRAVQHLSEGNPDLPFFLWVHYIDPHVPYYPPEELAKAVDPNYEGLYASHFGDKEGESAEHDYPSELGKERAVFHNDLGDEINQHIRRLYAADIRQADLGIAQLLAEARRIAQDHLIVILTADHGESLGEHDYFYSHGDYLYNPGLKVPLAVVLPNSHPLYATGRVKDRVSLIDILPTVLDLAGVVVESPHLLDIDGLSLIPYWRGEGLKPRALYAESDNSFYPLAIKRRVRFDTAGRFRCVFFNQWKLIWTPEQEPDLMYELYNLEGDPEEMKNIYSADHPYYRLLVQFLQAWMKPQDVYPPETKPSQKDLEILKSLGYIK
jgi:arylsulfatase A-like enzyme